MNSIQHTTGRAVKAILCAVIPNIKQHFAHNSRYINVGLGTNFARYQNQARCCQRLARTANRLRISRLTRW